MPKKLSLEALDDPGMNFLWIEDRAKELLEVHGLAELGWTFRLSATKRFMGRCFHDSKVIEVSSYFEHVERPELEDTILHEIAHGLAGYKAGHGIDWKRVARSIGAKPERCYGGNIQSSAEYNYLIECTGCGNQFYRYRLRPALLNRYHCSICKGKFVAYEIGKET